MNRVDSHHVLHNALEWSLRPEAKKLRETSQLIARTDRSLHNLIHKECPPIPLLGHHALLRVLRTFEPVSTVTGSMDNLMTSIEESINHPKVHRIEKSLAELAVEAIYLQREYLS